MWRKAPISLILLAALACPAFSRSAPPRAEGDGTTLEQKVFSDVLDGRSITLRIYPNASGTDGSFTLIDLPLIKGTIQSSAIKAAYPSISQYSLVLAWASDQTDPVITANLGRSIWVRSPSDSEGLGLSLSQLAVEREAFDSWWTLLDARGEPIPRASVTVYAYLGSKKTEMLLGQDATDDLGRLQRWIPHGTMSFLLKVEHPDYGIATVQYASPQNDHVGVYWVPLAPRDSEAAARGIQGNVLDGDGRPVAGAIVKCTSLILPVFPWYVAGSNFNRAVTNAEGWFALCVPVLTTDLKWNGLQPEGTEYTIEITAPTGSNLGGPFVYGSLIHMRAGSRQTFVLPPKSQQTFYHRFAFQYAEGIVTETEDLEKIKLAFIRNGFEWLRVGYEYWQHGWSLPSGVLRAVIERWPGEEFHFQEIEITESSPEGLIFKSSPAIQYRGHVIDGATGAPMPDVFVAVGRVSDRWEGPSLVDELSWQFQAQAAGEPTDQGPPLLYRTHHRVIQTDAQGAYGLTFMPGVSAALNDFTAVLPGRLRASIAAPFPMPDAEGIVDLPPIEVPRADGVDGFVSFIFEDEGGPVTESDRLGGIMIEVRTPGGRGYAGRFEDFRKSQGFIAGTYCAEVIWNDRYYTFEPVDLTQGLPPVAIFRPKSITLADVTCTGRVVHGITGEPIGGAVVLYNRMPGAGHLSSLTPEQWAAIDALEGTSDAANPVLAPLLNLLVLSTAPAAETIPQIVRTDAQGWFSLRWRQEPFTRRADCLQAFARDFLGAQQQLTFLARAEGDPAAEPELRRLEPGANGVIAIRPMKLFPAGTVVCHPVVPDLGGGEAVQNLRLAWAEFSVGIITSWIEDLRASPMDHEGASLYRPTSIRPNQAQSIQIPAGVNFTLSLQMQSPDHLPAIRQSMFRKQGQTLDLGRLEFQPAVEVVAKLIDSAGNLVSGVCVEYKDENWLSAWCPTDTAGSIRVRVPACSTGAFSLSYQDDLGRGTMHFPYRIGGREDTGKEFILQVPDSFLDRVRQAGVCSSETRPRTR